MFLFLISFLLIFVSSYLFACFVSPKKNIIGILNLFLIAFAQIILTFELLSLFNLIKPIPVLILNGFFLIISIILFKKFKPQPITIDFKRFTTQFFNALELDKSLIFLVSAFLFFIVISIILCILMPITAADSLAYHLTRVLYWISNGTLNHFITPDIRSLCMPINSEILYTWVMLFLKNDYFLTIFTFISYLLGLISLYKILSFMGFSMRKKIWTICILSSFAGIVINSSSPETDLIIASLFLTSIAIFWQGIKNNDKKSLFMSSLAWAISIGVKTPAIIASPALLIMFLYLSLHYKKKEFYKPLIFTMTFLLGNFLLFSSFNYILNFINYGNPMGAKTLIEVSKNNYGILAIPTSSIKYFFQFIDFTGFRWNEYIGIYIIDLRDFFINLLNLSWIQDGLYTRTPSVNNALLEVYAGAGILGFLIFLPTLFWAFLNGFINKFKFFKIKTLFVFSLMFFIYVCCLSYIIAFMVYNIRLIMFFTMVTAPVIVYSYFKKSKFIKPLIIIFAIFYLTMVSTRIWQRPFFKIINLYKNTNSISKARDVLRYHDIDNPKNIDIPESFIADTIRKKYQKSKKILFFAPSGSTIYPIKALEFEGYKIDTPSLETFDFDNMKNYDLVILSNNTQLSTVINDFENFENRYKVLENNGIKSIFFSGNYKTICIYIQANKERNVIYKKDGTYPYCVECTLHSSFYKTYGLNLIDIVAVITKNQPESEKKFFYFYTIKK